MHIAPLFTKTVSLIRVPFDLGAGRRGAALGPAAIVEAGLDRFLRRMGVRFESLEVTGAENTPPLSAEPAESPVGLKHLDEVVRVNIRLADTVSAAVREGRFPLVLGGDHSVAIGTIAGLAAHYRNLGVIWFDAHADLNTAESSPSGNIHGMSLAVSLGRGDPRLTHIHGFAPKLKAERVVIVGARSLDPGEKEFIRSQGIACYTMHEIDRMGIARVMDEAIARAGDGADGVHLSFDVDSVDPAEAPGTGTPVKGGVNYREAHFALERLAEADIVTSAEFVEVNPALDPGRGTPRLAAELICSLLGKRIL
jgi:arginase